MTIREAIEHCEDIISDNECRECANDHIQLKKWLKELVGLKEREEKYKWHNLEINPNDLPSVSHNVLFATLDGCVQEGEYKNLYWVQFRWNVHINNCDVIAWRYIEPYKEQNDD